MDRVSEQPSPGLTVLTGLSPCSRSPSHLKPPLGPRSATLPSSPEPRRTPASAPPPQLNGGSQAPPHQPPEASGSTQSLSKKERSRLGGVGRQGSEMGKAAAAPPGKRKRRKRKRLEDSDTCPPLEGPRWSPERREEARAEPPAEGLAGEGGRQPVHGQGLVNGWRAGRRADGLHASKRKRRKGVQGAGGPACLQQHPPWPR